jgi:hypothetical protein
MLNAPRIDNDGESLVDDARGRTDFFQNEIRQDFFVSESLIRNC